MDIVDAIDRELERLHTLVRDTNILELCNTKGILDAIEKNNEVLRWIAEVEKKMMLNKMSEVSHE